MWLFYPFPFNVEWLVLVALVLLALGISGSYLLKGITFDLMDGIDTTQDRTKEQSLARAEMLSRIAKVCGAICATLWVAPDALGGVFPTWDTTLCVCTITMTVCSVIFFIGYHFYHQDWLTERPDWIVLRVLGARIQKLLMCNSW
ncbi:proton-dependent oligopeptide transporter family [Artemisia annua]|uniref:Proton-dependent oligopeptide transporter family n=1 Tax=Artemisia annua TaxID=35608 RepID=A0A2U1PQS2_ARTAN|nr:proton-dependent oligopeptide transporter family [Artemisia annua]